MGQRSLEHSDYTNVRVGFKMDGDTKSTSNRDGVPIPDQGIKEYYKFSFTSLIPCFLSLLLL